ncbi:MAG: ATP-dependent 6-phosphofructokinase [Spirochaetales bacterium]|nr:ATP-dependent 6-phosphofructokinase [Spirochaetales bacterium]
MAKKDIFNVPSLGECKIDSPLKMSSETGDLIVNYVNDNETILYNIDGKITEKETLESREKLMKAGPRKQIYFNPKHVHAGIVTCGGLCPGLNNVIRAIVRCLWYSYGVRRITGIKNGYKGFLPEYGYEPIELSPDIVDDIHKLGGTELGSARGGGDKVTEIVDSIERLNLNMLFTIGGDGTLRGARDIAEEIKKRGLNISIIGIPKTIDNDISFLEKSFGFETAVAKASEVVAAAHTEAHSVHNGIGLVKVMGRESGFIASHTAIAVHEANFVLIPEVKFDIHGENGLLEHLKARLKRRQHAVIIVAEGAGQGYLEAKNKETDASGNKKLQDVGIFLKEEISDYFKKEKMEVNIKYIDPSYIVRSAPADATDSFYCSRLGAHAVHAAMAGKTSTLISYLNNHYIYIPIDVAVSKRNYVDPEGNLWRDVLEATQQPFSMTNN